MLAMAQLEGGGVNAALDSMRIALQYAPRSQVYLLEMAQIYMAGKYWDAATAMLNRLKNGSDAKVAKSANEQLEGLPTLKKYGVPPQRTPDAGSPQPPASAKPSLAASSSSPLPSSSPGASKPPASPTLADRQTPQPEPEEDTSGDTDQPPAPPQPDRRPIQHVKGKLVSVDCAQAPAAVMTVSAGAKLLKLRTENYKALTLVGADEFSCAWMTRPVSVNYRAGGKADGDLVSIEVQ